ncbi:nucleotide disphospho-sugar-binding domain-containing protein [Streptomyces iconiensis]|uniref:DUF1205 domain-containing protein n=1 Tax=Streptomyces iconiensis TaxID=1384038 RepID=A0ABT7A6E8_9ACTN|nr:nucleotide disphospho-sugar-binding domain-containing protein [Streptomyces iconiensis]MDJ1136881.1 DUF1205 domain-containing protein [Streptomyces iconiensis]
MRVLIATSGWPTHFYLMTPLAWALRAAGHDVRIATTPSGTPAVLAAGLPAVTVGDDIDFIGIRQRALPHELSDDEMPESDEELRELMEDEGFGEILSAWQEATFGATSDLVDLARSWSPDLVVADTMSVGAIVAAHVVGVPAVRHLLATDILGSLEGETLLSTLPGFAERFAEHGVLLEGDPAHLTLDPCPPSIQPPPSPSRTQLRWVPYNGQGVMLPWLLDPPPRPRVCVTWGTSSVWSAGQENFLVPRVVAVLSEFDLDVVVTVGPGQRELLGDLPPDVRVLESFPIHLLMPTTEVLIHQGGSSSMLTGGYYGVRQLSLPYLPEQQNDAAAHAGTGAGIALPAEEADEERLREALDALLNQPSYAEGAARLQEEIHAQPTPVETVGVLEDLARR